MSVLMAGTNRMMKALDKRKGKNCSLSRSSCDLKIIIIVLDDDDDDYMHIILMHEL